MSSKNDGNQNPQNAKVLKLGFNISVSGDPGTDFEIVLDDKEQEALQSLQNEENSQSSGGEKETCTTHSPNHELEKRNIQEVKHPESTGAIPKHIKALKSTNSLESLKMSESEKGENSGSKDLSIIEKIQSTMEHFEKFSDHIKEIPRLRNRPVATSTPFLDKYNSKSESSLVYPEYRPRKYSYLYDFHSKKEYLKSSVKPLPPDLFLKPLPAEGYYKRGINTRYFDLEPYRQYILDNNLNKSSEYKSICAKSNSDIEKHEGSNEPLSRVLKKSDSESGDKQSTSSADSIKDIKIYQSGGILIMQTFKDTMDVTEKKDLSEFSAKLIENCNKLKMEVNSFQEDKLAISNSSDENKNLGKMVQFDLSSFDGEKSKSGDSSSNALKDEFSGRMESSESTSDCIKNKDTSPQGTSQSQDFPSLSTQENDSIVSYQHGMSPTYASSKRLEWDSGADIGYLNLDLTKENLSTIERIVLKGLSSDGLSEKNVVYEKKSDKNQISRSKFVLERKLSDSVIKEVTGGTFKLENESNVETSGGKNEETRSLDERESHEKATLSLDATEKTSTKGISSKENIKGEPRSKFEETKTVSNKNLLKRIPQNNTSETEPEKKTSEFVDKSINVNTLFENEKWQTPVSQSTPKEFIKPSESPTKPKLKRSPNILSKNKKSSSQRLSKVSKKTPVGFINTKLLDNAAATLEMGIPKKVYKKVEATPALNDIELSKEVEEIIIDQRFKIKQNVKPEVSKEPENFVKNKADGTNEVKTKSRPISASSSSNNTVLPKTENKENVEEKAKIILERSKFTDQIIQTSDYDRESVSVQAFASQVSSNSDFKCVKKNEVPKLKAKEDKENINTSSKNIQAFGLNSSLPKQLEHPKDTELIDNQHTKSTQFFGGPLNSLPNYHSNLVTKPGESCGRALNILKTKKSSKTEEIRLREENERNILANDPPKLTETTKNTKHGSNENKENLIIQKSEHSKRSLSKISKGNCSAFVESDKKESERCNVKAKKSPSAENSDCPQMSDEVSSVVLTSEVLKVHGDSIDRNIIQEKYFESQLLELEKRKMISKSTSMEIQVELEGDKTSGKEYITTGCQYSPQSTKTASGSQYQEANDDSFKDNAKEKTRKKAAIKHYSSNQHLVKAPVVGSSKRSNQKQDLGAGDSLPSSTQTAHSWVPGMANSRENTSGVGRARSFEYLPGHIYESSGNMREKLPDEAEQNLTTSCSSESDTSKGSMSGGGTRDSEGRNTLILENSTENSHSSDHLKILDENLAQLNFAVVKLWEKDAQVQSITRSLLASLWKTRGSGDCLAIGGTDTSKTEAGELPNNGKERGDTLSEISTQESKIDAKEREFSIACQTEEKSPSPDPEKFYEERKALERRISEEKKCQIKWIENEINHLNILRQLLEKQNSPIQEKKKHSPLTVSSMDASKSEENYPKNISTVIHTGSVTPVYGCTISLTESMPPEKSQPGSEENDYQSRNKERSPAQYRMAVSLSDCSKNWRRLVMLPVGLQVSLKDTKLLKEGVDDEMDVDTDKENQSRFHRHSVKSNEYNNTTMNRRLTQLDINTQYPSPKKVSECVASTSVQTDFPSPEKSNQCTHENCYCINLTENSSSSAGHSFRSRTSEKRDSLKLRFLNEESDTENGHKTSNTTIPELVEVENDSVSHSDNKVVAKSLDERLNLSERYTRCKSIQSTTCKCQTFNEKSDSSGSCTKHVSVESVRCKCQSSPERGSSAVNKPGIVSRGPCQSNIYLNCDKPSSDFGTCRCSKIHVQKSSNCNCHIIKIHGSKCSSEKSSCSCKRPSLIKKTENQSCQTDEPQIKLPPEIKNVSQSKTVVERKMSVVEKFSCDPKVAYEVVHPTASKIGLQEKSASESKISEENVSVKSRTPVSNCSCKRRAEKEKAKVDDHPRHYFLRIEETEVESNEPVEQRKSLEVITVTVPVKKAGKSKIYGSNVRQIRRSNQEDLKSFVDVPSSGCNCCAECIKSCSKPTRDYRPCRNRSREEEPETPTRNSGLLKPRENNYCEDRSFYRGTNCPPKDLPFQFPSPQDYYQDRSVSGVVQPESSYSERFADNSYESHCCENCNCVNRNALPTKEMQNDYEFYKKRKRSNERENKKNFERHEGTSQESNLRSDARPLRDGWTSESRHPQKFTADADRYNPEYYNYNKREFMTKSELLKEEEQRHKLRQPSLQECLSSNRPDFYSSAERRRQIISERAKERAEKHNSRMECLIKMMQHCNENEHSSSAGPKRIFTTVQMREQTMKRYKKLPEVTGKVADQKKKEEYRTNRLMADIFAKKLQIEALKGHINLSNSVSVLYTI